MLACCLFVCFFFFLFGSGAAKVQWSNFLYSARTGRLGLFFIQIFIDLVDRKIAAKSKTKPKEPTLLR